MNMTAQSYNDKVVRYFILGAVFWGALGMSVGVMIASQLVWPELNFNSEYFQFGRLRPVHTHLVIFGFTTSILMATSLYIVQRTGRTPLFSNSLSWMMFYGWQTVLALGVITLLLGYSTTKEYSELEWPLDILFALTWIIYAVLFFRTLALRKENHIFVANWFMGAFILVIAVVFIMNNLALPASMMKSYSIYAGQMDAMVQWYWGHNAVGFLLTAGMIGANYYFLPKIAERPIYSYRLSVIHFWGILGFYTWAGAHHLIYSSVPDWFQNVGMVMSVILWVPSWVGAYNHFMTLLLNPEKLKTDYLMMFYFSALAYYALATFEGPLLAIRWFNMVSHYSDWIIGHVHSGALGWVGMSAFPIFYYLIPRLFNRTELWSQRLLKYHFWLAHIGIAFYVIALWVAGIGEGYMWLSQEDNGTLSYSFIDAMHFIEPWMLMRAIGGGLFTLGVFLMIYNLYRTVKSEPKQVGMAMQGVH